MKKLITLLLSLAMVACLFAGCSGDTELLYYGKKHEKRWCADSKYRRHDDIAGGIYLDRMDFCVKMLTTYRLAYAHRVWYDEN